MKFPTKHKYRKQLLKQQLSAVVKYVCMNEEWEIRLYYKTWKGYLDQFYNKKDGITRYNCGIKQRIDDKCVEMWIGDSHKVTMTEVSIKYYFNYLFSDSVSQKDNKI